MGPYRLDLGGPGDLREQGRTRVGVETGTWL
jgi:hypothetical protein